MYVTFLNLNNMSLKDHNKGVFITAHFLKQLSCGICMDQEVLVNELALKAKIEHLMFS